MSRRPWLLVLLGALAPLFILWLGPVCGAATDLMLLDDDARLVGQEAPQRWLALSDIPAILPKVLVLSEDHRFWSHCGVDFKEYYYIARASLADDKALRGGSTLTMQLARTIWLDRSRSLLRKTREIAIAWLLEIFLSKDEIMENYLNHVNFHEQHVGLAAAAALRGKSARHLDLHDAVYLVALLPAPATRNQQSHQMRRHVLYLTLEHNHIISREDYCRFTVGLPGISKDC